MSSGRLGCQDSFADCVVVIFGKETVSRCPQLWFDVRRGDWMEALLFAVIAD